jgi:hypothetical protein
LLQPFRTPPRLPERFGHILGTFFLPLTGLPVARVARYERRSFDWRPRAFWSPLGPCFDQVEDAFHSLEKRAGDRKTHTLQSGNPCPCAGPRAPTPHTRPADRPGSSREGGRGGVNYPRKAVPTNVCR